MKDDIKRVKMYLSVAKDLETRIAPLRLIEILEVWRKK